MARVLFVQNIWFKMFGTMILSRCLKDRGHTVELALGGPAAVVRRARHVSPDLIAFSCMTMEVRWLESMIRHLRRAGIRAPVVLGGAHATICPEVMERVPVDFLCVGEGERALPELAEALDAGREPVDVRNLCFRRDGRTLRNPLRPLVSDLDGLGFHDRSLYDAYGYFRDESYDVFMMSRGCPYGCTFCYNHLWHDLYETEASRFVRFVSVEHGLEELRRVRARRRLEKVLFADNLFVYNRDWFREFMNRYAEEIGLPFTCTIRAEHTSEETIRLLKRANCTGVRFAVETGNEGLRKGLLGKPISNRRLIELADLLHSHDMPFLTYNMFALPTETVDHCLETIRLNQRLRPTFMSNNIFMPYPKYRLTEQAKARGLLRDEDLDRLSEKAYRMDRSVLRQPNVRTLENLHKLSFTMIRRPGWTGLLGRAARLPPNPVFKWIYGWNHARDFMRLTGTSPARFAWQVIRNYRAVG